MATLEGSYNGLTFGPGTDYHVSGVEGLWDATDVDSSDMPRLGAGSYPGRDRQGGRSVIVTYTIIGATPAAYDALISTFRDAMNPGAGDNLLTAHQASLEDAAKGTTGWSLYGNAANLARSTVAAADGAASLSLDATLAGAPGGARTSIATAGVAVTPGRKYTGLVSARTANAGRELRAQLSWYNSAGTPLSESLGANTASVANTFVATSVTATAPSNAAFAAVAGYLVPSVANEVLYLDRAAIHQGNSTVWTAGGRFGRIERPLWLMGNTVWIHARVRRRIVPIITDQPQRYGVATVEFHSTSPAVYGA